MKYSDTIALLDPIHVHGLATCRLQMFIYNLFLVFFFIALHLKKNNVFRKKLNNFVSFLALFFNQHIAYFQAACKASEGKIVSIFSFL